MCCATDVNVRAAIVPLIATPMPGKVVSTKNGPTKGRNVVGPNNKNTQIASRRRPQTARLCNRNRNHHYQCHHKKNSRLSIEADNSSHVLFSATYRHTPTNLECASRRRSTPRYLDCRRVPVHRFPETVDCTVDASGVFVHVLGRQESHIPSPSTKLWHDTV